MSYEDTLFELCQNDERIVVMTAENRAAIRGLPPKLGERFIDVGIAEQTMIGMAAGLALRGRVPICHSLATFLTLRAFEFIRTDVGIPRLPVKLVGGVPGFLSDANGPTHQAIEDIGILRCIPHMQIVCPSDEVELEAALPIIMKSNAPCYIRYNACPPAVKHSEPFEFGKAETLSEGRDVTLLTYGFLLREVWKAREVIESRGYSVRVVNVRTPKPLDEKAILKAAKESSLTVIIEDHFLTGGLYSIVSEVLVRHGVMGRVLPIALEEKWFKPALLADVLSHEGFTGEQLAHKVLRALG